MSRERYGSLAGPAGDKVAELTALHPGWSATEIHRQLELDGDEVGLRTVQRAVKAARAGADHAPDALERWTIADLDAEDTARVLEVLQELAVDLPQMHPETAWPSRRHAEMIALVRRLAPDIPRAIDSYHLGLFAADGGRGLEVVSVCIASAPWRSPSPRQTSASAFWRRLQVWDDVGRWMPARDPEIADEFFTLVRADVARRVAPPVALEDSPTE